MAKLPQLCTLLEASTILGESYTLTQEHWRKRGWRPVGRMGRSLVFLRDDVSQYAKVYRGMTQKPLTLSNGYLTSRGAADFLGVRFATLQNRYRMWGLPFYRHQKEPRRLCFLEQELTEWTQTSKARQILRRNRRSTPTLPAPSDSS